MFSTIALACFACSSDDESGLKNDMIKKTLPPLSARRLNSLMPWVLRKDGWQRQKPLPPLPELPVPTSNCTPGSQHEVTSP